MRRTRPPGMTPALEQVYKLLVETAARDEPCPSNGDMALRLGVTEEATISQRVSLLIQRGFIKSNFDYGGRQVMILETGARTAPQSRQRSARTLLRQKIHRVDSKRTKDRIRRLREHPPEKPEEEPEALEAGMVRWGRDWDQGLDEASRWLQRAISDMQERVA